MLSLTETPMPTPSMTVDPVSVTPGFIGFAAIVMVVLAVILLIWDMNRRIRRVRYREEVREELDAEEAALAAEQEAPGQGSPSTPGTDSSSATDQDPESPTR
jgi:hypothetical protein